jgi:hypothetical protein
MESVLQAQRDILRYLIDHEAARDTVDGIEKWWLPQDRLYGVADIAGALAQLQKRELIRVWTPASSVFVYGRAPGEPELLRAYLDLLDAEPRT